MYVVGKPALLRPKKYLERVEKILYSGTFTNQGPYVRRLESAIEDYMGAYCVAVANATLGLQLVWEQSPHRWITTQSFTFVATVNALTQEWKPNFGDIDPNNFGLDPNELKGGAACAVNLFGGVCDIEKLEDACRWLIFDSAHALGVEWDGRPVGVFGNAEVFSLHATKFINGGEGGLITTRSQELAERLRRTRNFGFIVPSANRHGQLGNEWGTNAKMSEFHAALALTNWEDRELLREVYHQHWETYAANLPFPLYNPQRSGVKSNFAYVVGFVDPDKREALLDGLYERGVFARKYFEPLHVLPGHHPSHYPHLKHTEEIARKVICFPTGPSLSQRDILTICEHTQRVLETL